MKEAACSNDYTLPIRAFASMLRALSYTVSKRVGKSKVDENTSTIPNGNIVTMFPYAYSSAQHSSGIL